MSEVEVKQASDAEFFNQLAQTWDQTRERDEDKIRFLVDKIRLNLSDKVLDLGSGTGVLLPFLAASSSQVTALDFSEGMLEEARKKYRSLPNVDYVVADLFVFAPEVRFTKIVGLNFYPHIKDKQSFAAKIKSLLKTGGTLTIMHDISRVAVNAIHSGSEVVREDKLKAITVEQQVFVEAGFEILQAEDEEDYYFLQVKKK